MKLALLVSAVAAESMLDSGFWNAVQNQRGESTSTCAARVNRRLKYHKAEFKILRLSLKLWPKIEILPQIEILVKNPNFGQKSEFWSKIGILVKTRNFG